MSKTEYHIWGQPRSLVTLLTATAPEALASYRAKYPTMTPAYCASGQICRVAPSASNRYASQFYDVVTGQPIPFPWTLPAGTAQDAPQAAEAPGGVEAGAWAAQPQGGPAAAQGSTTELIDAVRRLLDDYATQGNVIARSGTGCDLLSALSAALQAAPKPEPASAPQLNGGDALPPLADPDPTGYAALLEAADWISRCARLTGPAGTSCYVISDEKMAQLRAAIAKARSMPSTPKIHAS